MAQFGNLYVILLRFHGLYNQEFLLLSLLFLLPSFSKYSGFIFKSSVLVLLAVVLFHVSRVNHKSPAKFGSIADLYINENES